MYLKMDVNNLKYVFYLNLDLNYLKIAVILGELPES